MFKHEYADVNGIRMHYVTRGTGKLIMFVHGFPEFWYEWKNQLDYFGKDYQAVAIDVRGYNLSSKPEGVEQYKPEIVAEDWRQLAEKLGHKKFTLVAHNLNGIAYIFAYLFPDYLEKLITINVPHPSISIVTHADNEDNRAQIEAHKYIAFYQKPGAEGPLAEGNYYRLVRATFTGKYGGDDLINEGLITDDDVNLYIEAWSQPGALTGMLNHYRALDLVSLPTENLIIKVPTLVIWGMQDPAMLPVYLDGLDNYIPELTIKRIPDAAHRVVHKKPDLVNSLIEKFLEK